MEENNATGAASALALSLRGQFGGPKSEVKGLLKLPLAALVFLYMVTPAQADGIKFSCNTKPEQAEDVLLKQAPSGAKRIGKHILEIKTKNGEKRFRDKPPYDEPLSGVRFEYCGYSKELHAHLISEASEGFFTGTLLFEDTGRALPAGPTVLISSDRERFLAIEQANGKGLEDWTIYDIRGNKLWSGDGGLLEKSPEYGFDTISAEFDNPQWSEDSSLTAAAQIYCQGTYKQGKAMLMKSGNEWHWVLDVSCEKK